MSVSADSSNMSSLLEKGWFLLDFHALNSYYQDRNDYCSFLCCRLYNPYFCWHYTRKGLKFQDIFVVIFSVLAGVLAAVQADALPVLCLCLHGSGGFA